MLTTGSQFLQVVIPIASRRFMFQCRFLCRFRFPMGVLAALTLPECDQAEVRISLDHDLSLPATRPLNCVEINASHRKP